MEERAGFRPKYVELNRAQLGWRELDLEDLIGAEHPARAIWEVTGKLDLSGFEQFLLSAEEGCGRPSWPPQLLVSVWIYAYSQAVASARAIERMMPYEPGLRWLTADQVVNHHTLSDFRIRHGAALKRIFVQVLGVMDQEGMVELGTLLQDGTKIQAAAGKQSMHRETTLRQRLQQAQAVVEELERREQDREPEEEREQQRRQRRAAARLQRMQAAIAELELRQSETPASERQQVRVSESEPEARKMKHPEGGWLPSYNLQVTTEPKHSVIVSVAVTTDGNDTQQMQPAVERFFEHTARWPNQAIADGGYATRDNVEALTRQEIALLAPWKTESSRQAGANQVQGRGVDFSGDKFAPSGEGTLRCPQGKPLELLRIGKHHGLPCQIFQAQAEDCRLCPARKDCCGDTPGPRRVERVVESAAMQAYLDRMKDPATLARYQLRCAVAEFPHLIMKARWKWKRFSVRGKSKAQIEALWVALAYNVTRWMRARTLVPVPLP